MGDVLEVRDGGVEDVGVDMVGVDDVPFPAAAPVALELGRMRSPMKSGWLMKSRVGPAKTALEFVPRFVLVDREFAVWSLVMNTYMGPVTFAGTMQFSIGS